MSKRDTKLLARHWADTPDALARDLRDLVDWIEANGFTAPVEEKARQQGALAVIADMAVAVMQRLGPVEAGLREYRRMMPPTRLNTEFLQPVTEAFSAVADNVSAEVLVENFSTVKEEIAALESWARTETRRMSGGADRSELLQASIEELGDEILLTTDADGSLKLRGSMSIPMFMALWNAPKHRLRMQLFRDISPRTNEKNMDRHRARLCARLQDVLIEVVADATGVSMQKCRN